MPLTSRQKALAATTVGLAALAFAAAYALRRNGGLGYLKTRVRKGGMLLEEHFDPIMPIGKRVSYIQKLVEQAAVDPEVRHLALAITGNRDQEVTVGKYTFQVHGARCPGRDVQCEIRAIHDWVKENVRYTGDVAPILRSDGRYEAIDFFASPKRTAEIGGEDCDGHAGLNAALLSHNGVTAKLRVTAPPSTPDWGHIYAVAGVPKEAPTHWVSVDTTLPHGGVGVEAPYSRLRDFPA